MLVLAVFMTVRSAIWEARYTAGSGTYIITLPENAIWNPPPVPPYSKFAVTFDSLPAAQPTNSRVYRLLKWDWMLLELLLYFLASFVLVAPLYWLTRRSRPDRILHVSSWVGIGMAGAAMVCFTLWLAIGGWGPPAPLFFAIAGMLSGAVIGFATIPKMAANHPMQPSGEIGRIEVEGQLSPPADR